MHSHFLLCYFSKAKEDGSKSTSIDEILKCVHSNEGY